MKKIFQIEWGNAGKSEPGVNEEGLLKLLKRQWFMEHNFKVTELPPQNPPPTEELKEIDKKITEDCLRICEGYFKKVRLPIYPTKENKPELPTKFNGEEDGKCDDLDVIILTEKIDQLIDYCRWLTERREK